MRFREQEDSYSNRMITIANNKRDEAVALLRHFLDGAGGNYNRDANAKRRARKLIAYLERLQPATSEKRK